ncbi:lipoprotein [Pseudomonas sp. Os17]|uniref:hypothetical protein n=1 Tax=Pseudomonas TaxID=286 RepID=UPI0005FCAFB5|nr:MULTISPECIES: hypothetical protein [Pseudomonas]RXU69914.1 hypothetical protein CW358_04455 [Pseudomonas protegens]BAQ73274.1 lipoprotein [Pseudomonas sp. Os17]
MRLLSLLFTLVLLAGCASTPDYYISPKPVQIPATATYWIDTFNLQLVGESERFLPEDKLRQQLGMELIRQLGNANRYAASKDSADYLLDVDAVYKRRLSDSKGGLVSMVVDDNTILASVDFGYKVQVKRDGAEVLHFAQERNGLQPAGAMGQLRNMKSMLGVITNSGNSDVENFYIRALPKFIVSDIKAIPSR